MGLNSGNDTLHGKQEGKVYIFALYSLFKSKVIGNEKGTVAVKSEGRIVHVSSCTRRTGRVKGEKTVNEVKDTKIEYKEGAYNCRMTAAVHVLNDVIVFGRVCNWGNTVAVITATADCTRLHVFLWHCRVVPRLVSLRVKYSSRARPSVSLHFTIRLFATFLLFFLLYS